MHTLVLPLFTIALTLSCLAPAVGRAQGRGAKNTPAQPEKSPPGQAKKVTTSSAVVAIREIFGRNGYDVLRVEAVKDAQVVYYRRGNMGRGKGQGPIEQMIVRPRNDIVVFEGGPSGLVVDIKLRLGL